MLSLLGIAAPLTGSAFAKEAVVTTKDGRQLVGEVISDDAKGVTLSISSIQTPIPRENIQSVEYRQSVEEQYKERRSKIDDGNLDERYKLAYWLFEQRAYNLAKQELDELSRRFPDDTKIQLLRSVVDDQIKLSAEGGRAADGEDRNRPPVPRPAETKPATDAQGLPNNRLTKEQVNLIKVHEIEPSDRPRVFVPREAIDILFSKYAASDEALRGRENQAAFKTAPGWQQLSMIFKVKARELYPMVRVDDQPKRIQAFRTGVHRNYILNYCATAGCHGGPNAGDLFLFRTNPDSDETVYTNFLTLQRYADSNGYMLDFAQPESSYLLQYGLPRDRAVFPHPEVRGWRHEFATENDPRYLNMVDWIRSFGNVRYQYPVDYKPPTLKPTTAPATQPAGAT